MNRKQWLMLMGALIAFLSVVICVMIVFNSHVQTIYLGLKKGITLMNARSMIAALLTKLICATILVVSGVYCVYLHYQTFENNRYITLASAFFLGAGVIMTLMDYKVLFYATGQSKRVWQLGGDISLMLFTGIMLRILLFGRTTKWPSVANALYILIHFCMACAMALSTPVKSWRLLKWYGYFAWAMPALMVAISFRAGLSLWRGMRLLMMVALLLFVMLVGASKIDTLNNLYTTYLDLTPYFVVIYTQLVFAMVFRFQRKDIILGRTALSRLQEMHIYEQLLVRNTMLRSFHTLDEFCRRSQEIVDNAHNVREELMELSHSLQTAADGLSTSMPYTRLNNISLKLDLSQTSLDIVFCHVQLELQQTVPFESIRFTVNCPPQCHVSCDPNLLIRACHTLVRSMADISSSGHVCLDAKIFGENVGVLLHTDIHGKRHEARRIIRLLRRGGTDLENTTDEDLSLLMAKTILSAHGTRIGVSNAKNHLSLNWQLPRWQDKPDEPPSPEDQVAEGSHHSIRVVLVSTSTSQINFVRSSLNHSFYSLRIFKDINKLLNHLQSAHVNVIIVGTLSINITSVDFCRAIRKSYSLGLMPIILIHPNDAFALESSFVQLVNDVILEPFSHTELNRRILSLSMLQRSTEELRRARLEFLQSQMNPHFIFNAISAIMPLCIRAPHKAYALLGSFSDYLRGNLFPRQNNCPILVQKEIDLIRAYLTLENVRLEDRIVFTIAEEYDEDSIIFPLLIEPVVENSVKHGLNDKESPSTTILHIDVRVIQHEDVLDIVIKDDGIGFDISRMNDQPHKPSGGHRSIGLSNLNARLNLYYGASLTIESAVGQGTCVSFSIPNHYDFAPLEALPQNS